MRRLLEETLRIQERFSPPREPATFALRCESKKPDPGVQPPEIRANWSGTPGSNRRPSPWQGPDEDVHGDATRVNPAESLAPPCPSGEAVVSAEAAGCSPFTDAGLTRSERSLPPSIAAIPDDRCSPLGTSARCCRSGNPSSTGRATAAISST